MHQHEYHLEEKDALEFMFSGYAIVTFQSLRTGTRFTYKIVKAKPKKGQQLKSPLHYVMLLRGPNNHKDYTYMGHCWNKNNFTLRESEAITKEAESYKAFIWVFKKLLLNSLNNKVAIYRYNFCGRCGELLTVPESIMSGYGPVCIKMVEQSRRDRAIREKQLSLHQ